MKRKIALLMLVAGSLLKINAQVLTEDFTAPFTLNAATGWTVQNNSAPQGTIGWFQGNSVSTFSAYNGALNDYFAANYNSTSANNAPGTISNWLISPTVSLVNGATIEFATRTINTNTVYPDRMQVLVSNTSSINLPQGATSTGNFTVAFDVNSSLSSSTTAVLNQTAGVVVGYPQSWTTYTATVTGITGTVTGRLAFRYFVTNAGPVGVNGNYIGLDAVKYTLPCAKPTFSLSSSLSSTTTPPTISVCSGSTVDLNSTVTGTIPVNSYTWSSGANSASTVVTPSASGIYTLWGTSSAGCVGSQTIAVTATVTPSISIPVYTICAGSQATLTASGATSYTWAHNSATSSAVVISPTATTVYTVTGTGATSVCPSVMTTTVTVGPQLSMDITTNASTICAGQVVTVNVVSATSSYSWNTGSTAASFTASPASSTVYAVAGVLGSGTNACTGSNSVAITVNSNPTFTVSQVNSICSGGTFSASASGANSHLFMFLSFSSTNNPVSYTTSPVNNSTTVQYSVVGTGTNGCSVTSVQAYTINANPNITASASKLVECILSSVTLSASGAHSYTWSGSASGTNSSLTFPTGTLVNLYPFTVAGTSSVTGCIGTTTIGIQVSNCTGLEQLGEAGENAVRVFPNPFNDELKFSGLEAEGHLEIYNMLGQMVIKSSVSEKGTLNTEGVQKGLYIVKVFNSSGKEIKLLKLVHN